MSQDTPAARSEVVAGARAVGALLLLLPALPGIPDSGALEEACLLRLELQGRPLGP